MRWIKPLITLIICVIVEASFSLSTQTIVWDLSLPLITFNESFFLILLLKDNEVFLTKFLKPVNRRVIIFVVRFDHSIHLIVVHMLRHRLCEESIQRVLQLGLESKGGCLLWDSCDDEERSITGNSNDLCAYHNTLLILVSLLSALPVCCGNVEHSRLYFNDSEDFCLCDVCENNVHFAVDAFPSNVSVNLYLSRGLS